MSNTPKDNHGEGDPVAARRFNKAEQAFVDSARGKQAVLDAGQARPDEEAELVNAERIGKRRAKGLIRKV
jgi:hypothetical protein